MFLFVNKVLPTTRYAQSCMIVLSQVLQRMCTHVLLQSDRSVIHYYLVIFEPFVIWIQVNNENCSVRVKPHLSKGCKHNIIVFGCSGGISNWSKPL